MYCSGPYAGGRHRSLCLAIVTHNAPRWAHLRIIDLTIHQHIHTRKILSKSLVLSSPELVIDTDRLFSLCFFACRLSLSMKTSTCANESIQRVWNQGFSFLFSIDLRGPYSSIQCAPSVFLLLNLSSIRMLGRCSMYGVFAPSHLGRDGIEH